jgi:hypothetical protein
VRLRDAGLHVLGGVVLQARQQRAVARRMHGAVGAGVRGQVDAQGVHQLGDHRRLLTSFALRAAIVYNAHCTGRAPSSVARMAGSMLTR